MGRNKKASQKTTQENLNRGCALLNEKGELSAKLKQCLVQIFSRFDADGDKILCQSELQAFSRAANKDGHEFKADELESMQEMFDWQTQGENGGGMTLRGFVQMYTEQTRLKQAETRSDLERLGYSCELELNAVAADLDSKEDRDACADTRRSELEANLRTFADSGELSLAFPATLSSSDRQLVHALAADMGLQSQSFGVGKKRSIHVFKLPEVPVTQAAEGFENGDVSEDKKPRGSIVFSGVELDAASSKLLIDTFRPYIADDKWEVLAHHMTICLGSLAEARGQKHGNLAEDLQASIRSLHPKQPIGLRAVSVGRGNGVIAIGVVGCPTVNKTPHVTLACAPGHKPVESNAIAEWEPLPSDKLLSLTGIVREFHQGQMADLAAKDDSNPEKRRNELLKLIKEKEKQILAAREKSMRKLQKLNEDELQMALQERESELERLGAP